LKGWRFIQEGLVRDGGSDLATPADLGFDHMRNTLLIELRLNIG